MEEAADSAEEVEVETEAVEVDLEEASEVETEEVQDVGHQEDNLVLIKTSIFHSILLCNNHILTRNIPGGNPV